MKTSKSCSSICIIMHMKGFGYLCVSNINNVYFLTTHLTCLFVLLKKVCISEHSLGFWFRGAKILVFCCRNCSDLLWENKSRDWEGFHWKKLLNFKNEGLDIEDVFNLILEVSLDLKLMYLKRFWTGTVLVLVLTFASIFIA